MEVSEAEELSIRTELTVETTGLTVSQFNFVNLAISESVKSLGSFYFKQFAEMRDSENRLIELCNTPCCRYSA
jgi:hypothetical protein